MGDAEAEVVVTVVRRVPAATGRAAERRDVVPATATENAVGATTSATRIPTYCARRFSILTYFVSDTLKACAKLETRWKHALLWF